MLMAGLVASLKMQSSTSARNVLRSILVSACPTFLGSWVQGAVILVCGNATDGDVSRHRMSTFEGVGGVSVVLSKTLNCLGLSEARYPRRAELRAVTVAPPMARRKTCPPLVSRD